MLAPGQFGHVTHTEWVEIIANLFRKRECNFKWRFSRCCRRLRLRSVITGCLKTTTSNLSSISLFSSLTLGKGKKRGLVEVDNMTLHNISGRPLGFFPGIINCSSNLKITMDRQSDSTCSVEGFPPCWRKRTIKKHLRKLRLNRFPRRKNHLIVLHLQ